MPAWNSFGLVSNIRPYNSMAALVVRRREELWEKGLGGGDVVLKRLFQHEVTSVFTGSFISSKRVLTTAHSLASVITNAEKQNIVLVSVPLECVCVLVPEYLRLSAAVQTDVRWLLQNGGLRLEGAQCLCPTLASQLQAWAQGSPCPEGPDQAILHLTEAAPGVRPVTIMPGWSRAEDFALGEGALCLGLATELFRDNSIRQIVSCLSETSSDLELSAVPPLPLPPKPTGRLKVEGCNFDGMGGGADTKARS